jgi:hypothetical protein
LKIKKCVKRYFGNYRIKIVRPLYINSLVPNVDIDNEMFTLDSTSISCSINLLAWAEEKYSRGAVVDFEALYRIQSIGVFFVTRAKDTIRYEVVEQNYNIDETTGLRSDKTVLLTVAKSKKLYPEKLRLVEFYDQENSGLLMFLTNNFEITALEVANLYKNRWKIEIFSNGLSKISQSKSFGDIPKMLSEYNFG